MKQVRSSGGGFINQNSKPELRLRVDQFHSIGENNPSKKHCPLPIVNLDHSRMSGQMAKKLFETPQFNNGQQIAFPFSQKYSVKNSTEGSNQAQETLTE